MLPGLKRKVTVVLDNDTVVTQVPNKIHNSESGSNIKIFLILFFIIGLLVIILLFISRIRDLLRTKHYPQNYDLSRLEAAERRRRSSTATTTASSRRTRERFLIRPEAEEIRRRRSSRLARLNSFIRFWRQQSGNNATENSGGGGGQMSSLPTADGFGRRHTIAMTDSSVEPLNTVGELTNEQYLQLFNQILRSELTTTAASGGGVNPMLRHLLGNYSPQYQQTVENELWQLVANQPPPSYSEVMINKDQFREPKIMVDQTNLSTIRNEETGRQFPSLATHSIETSNENSLVEPPPPSYSQLSKIV